MNIKLPLIALCLASLTPSIASADLVVEFTFAAPKKRAPRPPKPREAPVAREDLPAEFSDHDVCYEVPLQGSADTTAQFLPIERDGKTWHRAYDWRSKVLVCDSTERTASFD